jgi:nuclear GTP-binding protein
MLIYKTGRFEDVDEFLRQVGRIQGKLKKAGSLGSSLRHTD